ncbi:MAG: hypothetical protein LBG60_10580 [Bifidobacteriaceae bacterium]|jgi:hypothetical protein|nr:hypothetical protein [Bifidobacteriaceae bacterium]
MSGKLFVVIDDDLHQSRVIMTRLEKIYGDAEVVRLPSKGEPQNVKEVSRLAEAGQQDHYLLGGDAWAAFLRKLLEKLAEGAKAGKRLFVVADVVLSRVDLRSFKNELRTAMGMWIPRALIEIVKTVLKSGHSAEVILTSGYMGFTALNISSRLKGLTADKDLNEHLGRVSWIPAVMFWQSTTFDNAELKEELENPPRVFEYAGSPA